MPPTLRRMCTQKSSSGSESPTGTSVCAECTSAQPRKNVSPSSSGLQDASECAGRMKLLILTCPSMQSFRNGKPADARASLVPEVLLRGQRLLGERHDKKASERQRPPPALELRCDLKPAGKELRGRLQSARPSPSPRLATKLASACAAFTTSWSSGARVPLSPGLPSVTSSGGRPLPTSALQTACRSGPRP